MIVDSFDLGGSAGVEAASVDKEVLPLGIGMPGVQLLVRARSGQPAGVGEIGEIWFRSPHLALGYLDDPSGTCERFTGNGPDDDPGERTYRTGDRGRYRPDGTVEFFGRSDDQVQLRGFRIEPGEIQAVLGRHPGVRDAVVNLWSDDRSVPQLVAYVVPAATSASNVAELRQHLRTSLPPHMIPAHIVTIDRLPVTPNGKLDGRALPRPTIDASEHSMSSEPHDQLERMLVNIWREVLDRDHIGIHDDFFDLGGFSLLATRLFAVIEERTGKRLRSQRCSTPRPSLSWQTSSATTAGRPAGRRWCPSSPTGRSCRSSTLRRTSSASCSSSTSARSWGLIGRCTVCNRRGSTAGSRPTRASRTWPRTTSPS